MNLFGIASSGMAAATAQLNVSASNVANMGSEGPLTPAGGAPAATPAYQPLQLVQFGLAGGGVGTQVQPTKQGQQSAYDPSSPFANSDGLVGTPAVDLGQEMANQMMALTQFKANVRVLEVGDETTKTLLDMKA